MRPPFALLVALLLIGATVAPVDGLAGQTTTDDTAPLQVTSVAGTTNHLSIPATSVRSSGFDSGGVDVGTAIAAGSNRLHERHDAAVLENRFREARSASERTQLVRERLSTVEDREAALYSRQSTAISRYAAGDISVTRFLRVRALVDAQARELGTTIRGLTSLARAAPDYSLTSGTTTRIRNLDGSFQTLQGPVGHRLGATVTGAAEASSVYVEVADDGYMLATVDGDQYVRETRLNGERDTARPDQFVEAAADEPNIGRLDVADSRASELYTWLYDRQRPSFTFYGTSGIYELSATHPDGQLTAYLDGGTANVFYEQQTRRLSSVSTNTTATASNGTLRVTVQRSVETTPMLVSASNIGSGTPVDGDVLINGHPVGETGTSGSVWLVEPREPYTVTVTADNSTTTVDVPAS